MPKERKKSANRSGGEGVISGEYARNLQEASWWKARAQRFQTWLQEVLLAWKGWQRSLLSPESHHHSTKGHQGEERLDFLCGSRGGTRTKSRNNRRQNFLNVYNRLLNVGPANCCFSFSWTRFGPLKLGCQPLVWWCFSKQKDINTLSAQNVQNRHRGFPGLMPEPPTTAQPNHSINHDYLVPPSGLTAAV